ncbi:MAG TPA: ROK family protein [Verrucomicrobiae bacterium]|jgi:glucokinase
MADNNGKEFLVGVDLGGTKVLAGVFDPKLQLVGTLKVSTKSERGPEAVIERIARCVIEAVDECDLNLKQIKGIGLGAPGAVDPESGRVIFAPNLGWEDVALEKELKKQLEVPVFLENDCNICTLGVYEEELKSKPRHVIGIFLGTGIGGGLILNGELYSGFNHTAGELGHMVIDINGPKCGCGNKGCFEVFASRGALFRKVQAAVKDGQKTVLTEMLGQDLKDLRSGDLRKAFRRDDKLVEKIVEEAAEYTGLAVANLINLINPEVVVLGGGLIEQLADEMMPIITKRARASVMPGTGKGIEIIASKLGDNAGIVGGAVLARRKTK